MFSKGDRKSKKKRKCRKFLIYASMKTKMQNELLHSEITLRKNSFFHFSLYFMIFKAEKQGNYFLLLFLNPTCFCQNKRTEAKVRVKLNFQILFNDFEQVMMTINVTFLFIWRKKLLLINIKKDIKQKWYRDII